MRIERRAKCERLASSLTTGLKPLPRSFLPCRARRNESSGARRPRRWRNDQPPRHAFHHGRGRPAPFPPFRTRRIGDRQETTARPESRKPARAFRPDWPIDAPVIFRQTRSPFARRFMLTLRSPRSLTDYAVLTLDVFCILQYYERQF